MLKRRNLCSALCSLPVLSSVPKLAFAADNEIRHLGNRLVRSPDDIIPGLYLSVGWDFALSSVLTDSLRRGIPLYFLYEFRLSKSRWYWFDDDATHATFVQRISFSPLSQKYRLSQDGLTQSFDTLDQVLALIRNVRDWRVADLNAVDDIEKFSAQTRMMLDTSKLPRPLQISIGGNSDWILESDWEEVKLTPQLLTR